MATINRYFESSPLCYQPIHQPPIAPQKPKHPVGCPKKCPKLQENVDPHADITGIIKRSAVAEQEKAEETSTQIPESQGNLTDGSY